MTNRLTPIFLFMGAGAVSLVFARDDFSFGGASAHSDRDSNVQRGGARSAVSDQQAPRASAPATPSPSAPSFRPAGGSTERVHSSGAAVSARDTPQTTHTPAPVAQTVRQPDRTVVAPSRETARTSTRTGSPDSAKTERTRTTETTQNLTAPAGTRTFNAPHTPAVQRPVASDSWTVSHAQAPNEGIIPAHSRTDAGTTLRHNDSAASTSISHEPLDGRSTSFRTPAGERLSSVASLRAPRDAAANDRYTPASVNRPLPRNSPHESQTRLTSADHREVVTRHPSDDRSNFRTSFGSTALRHAEPYGPPHHYPDRYPPYYRQRDVYRPLWWTPVVYPFGFGMTWSSGGSYAFAVAPYAPAYACSYSYMPYYDSWYYGNRGCSSVYYGGWRHGWYGGFSYVCNPWPVYSTCYFGDPSQVVTQTETVYATQPAAATAPGTAVYAPEAAMPAAYDTSVPASEAVPASFSQTAVSNAPMAAVQAPAAKATPNDEASYGSEYETAAEDFSLGFASYAETLNAEMIWSSYAGFDRPDQNAETHLNAETAAIPSH